MINLNRKNGTCKTLHVEMLDRTGRVLNPLFIFLKIDNLQYSKRKKHLHLKLNFVLKQQIYRVKEVSVLGSTMNKIELINYHFKN